jgi:YYY domain-containing protein
MDQSFEPKSKKNRNLLIVGTLLTIILIVGAFLRFNGLFWGEYQYLHPDERFLIWVGTDISPVDSLSEYWDTANSSLNPHNRGHGFYVYGTLPLYLARYAVEWMYGHSGFNEMTNVGRSLSALADLLTVLLVYLVGAKAYGKRVGLLAAALSAFAVLQIQQSHFFTVDTFTTSFSMMAIYFAVRVAYDEIDLSNYGLFNSSNKTLQAEIEGSLDKNNRDSIRSHLFRFIRNPIFFNSIGFGIALGLAASSKASAAPLAILLPVALFIRISGLKGRTQRKLAQDALGYLILAGFVSLLLFRILQPMAFSGPGFFGILPNEDWIANLRELANQASGDVDFPPALQWARRPVWFAWENMVRWGMGLPMGILVWVGFLWVGWRMIKGEWRKHILLWGWTALIFVWQSLIFNPSMRYQLLIYPTLAIFAAWAVIRLFDWGKTIVVDHNRPQSDLTNSIDAPTRNQYQRSSKWAQVLAVIIGVGVLITTALYAFSFSNIYSRPITRVEASRWIYQNVPGPINLPIQTAEGSFNQQVSFPYNYIISQDIPYVSVFRAKGSGELAEISLHKIIDPDANFDQLNLRLKVSEIPGGGGNSESVDFDFDLIPNDLGTTKSTTVLLEQPLEVLAGEQYYLHLSIPPGQGPVRLNGEVVVAIRGAEISNESIPLSEALLDSTNPILAEFTSPGDGLLTEVMLNLILPEVTREKNLYVTIATQPDGREPLAFASYSGRFEAGEVENDFRLPLNTPVQLEEGQEYFLKIALQDSEGGIILRGGAVANEGAWDDGLPVRLDGYDGFAGIYEPGLNFDMYEDDNPNKLSRFYDILDHAEYILISSSRQWGSLPRIPERFPMTAEYYQHLLGCPPGLSIESCYNIAQVGDFQGDLGFELIDVFQSDPRIGPFRLNDQYSEEAFTVYDHPKVFIFRKGSDYDPEKVRQILGGVDLTKVVHITPKKAGDLPKDMLLPADRLSGQFSGGTWSQLFNVESWLNRWSILTVIVWYLVVALIGVIVYPILRFALPGLSDHGYPLSRIAGLLFLSYMVWLAGSIKIPFTRTTITIMIVFLMGISGLLVYWQRSHLRREWRERRNYFLVIEGLFLAFFVFDLLIRIGNPDLWHPWKGGEKPMDFSYLNAVLKSTTFPPYDPWFSGGYINYYYYGFVYVGVLVKWLGIVPSVAYNLIIPTLFSMIAMGAFSIGWNFVSVGKSVARKLKKLIKSLPFITGMAAALAVAVLGNLGTLRMIYQGYQRLAAPEGNIEGANFIIRIIWAVEGALMTLTGSSMPYGIADWYWFPSRAIPAPNDVEPITEFPFFTVLYGDPHAHLFALPLTLLALSWALSIIFARVWIKNRQDSHFKFTLRLVTSLLLGGLAIGALRPTNTWDFPIYLVFGLLAVGFAVWKSNQPTRKSLQRRDDLPVLLKWIILTLGSMLLLGGLAFLLYQPYATWYVQGYTDIQLWKGTHTPFWSYLTHWGVFLFVIISWLLWETREWMANTPLSALRKLVPYRGIILVGGLLSIVWIIALLILDVSIAWFVIPLIIWVSILLFQPELSDAKRAVLVMIAAGLSLTLMVEIIVIVGDIGRMNTVFKFYLQVWTLLALSAAAGFGWILASVSRWSPTWRSIWQAGVVLLVAGAALYPLLGGTAKIKDRMVEDVPLTLDGMAFMEYAEFDDLGTRMDLRQDYHAIRWLQDNVVNSPVIIEGNMVEYRWGTRNTIYTGLPNVIGWNWHQRQQRATAAEGLIEERISEVNEFYLTSDLERAKSILNKFDVEYIVVGQLERALYPGSGLQKFESMNHNLWHEVYRSEDTVIYQVN